MKDVDDTEIENLTEEVGCMEALKTNNNGQQSGGTCEG